MALEITVRGFAEKRYAAERATVTLSAAVEGFDKQKVYADAVAIQDPILDQLTELAGRGGVTSRDSDQVRVYSQRPWGTDGARLPLTHSTTVTVNAEFIDFERLSGFIDYWAGREGVDICAIVWDVTVKNRRMYEAEVRRAAVEDAVLKAQAYSDALRGGRVHAVRLADPGMLNESSASVDVPMPRMTMAVSGDAEGLTLTPGELVIRVEVDAKFVTD